MMRACVLLIATVVICGSSQVLGLSNAFPGLSLGQMRNYLPITAQEESLSQDGSSLNLAPLQEGNSLNLAPVPDGSSLNLAPVQDGSSLNLAPLAERSSLNLASLQDGSSLNVAPLQDGSSLNLAPPEETNYRYGAFYNNINHYRPIETNRQDMLTGKDDSHVPYESPYSLPLVANSVARFDNNRNNPLRDDYIKYPSDYQNSQYESKTGGFGTQNLDLQRRSSNAFFGTQNEDSQSRIEAQIAENLPIGVGNPFKISGIISPPNYESAGGNTAQTVDLSQIPGIQKFEETDSNVYNTNGNKPSEFTYNLQSGFQNVDSLKNDKDEDTSHVMNLLPANQDVESAGESLNGFLESKNEKNGVNKQGPNFLFGSVEDVQDSAGSLDSGQEQKTANKELYQDKYSLDKESLNGNQARSGENDMKLDAYEDLQNKEMLAKQNEYFEKEISALNALGLHGVDAAKDTIAVQRRNLPNIYNNLGPVYSNSLSGYSNSRNTLTGNSQYSPRMFQTNPVFSGLGRQEVSELVDNVNANSQDSRLGNEESYPRNTHDYQENMNTQHVAGDVYANSERLGSNNRDYLSQWKDSAYPRDARLQNPGRDSNMGFIREISSNNIPLANRQYLYEALRQSNQIGPFSAGNAPQGEHQPDGNLGRQGETQGQFSGNLPLNVPSGYQQGYQGGNVPGNLQTAGMGSTGQNQYREIPPVNRQFGENVQELNQLNTQTSNAVRQYDALREYLEGQQFSRENQGAQVDYQNQIEALQRQYLELKRRNTPPADQRQNEELIQTHMMFKREAGSGNSGDGQVQGEEVGKREVDAGGEGGEVTQDRVRKRDGEDKKAAVRQGRGRRKSKRDVPSCPKQQTEQPDTKEQDVDKLLTQAEATVKVELQEVTKYEQASLNAQKRFTEIRDRLRALKTEAKIKQEQSQNAVLRVAKAQAELSKLDQMICEAHAKVDELYNEKLTINNNINCRLKRELRSREARRRKRTALPGVEKRRAAPPEREAILYQVQAAPVAQPPEFNPGELAGQQQYLLPGEPRPDIQNLEAFLRTQPGGDQLRETLIAQRSAQRLAQRGQQVQEGVPQGLQQGVPQGLQQGVLQGVQQGVPQGYQQGVPQGYQQGEMVFGVPQGYPAGQMVVGVPQGVVVGNVLPRARQACSGAANGGGQAAPQPVSGPQQQSCGGESGGRAPAGTGQGCNTKHPCKSAEEVANEQKQRDELKRVVGEIYAEEANLQQLSRERSKAHQLQMAENLRLDEITRQLELLKQQLKNTQQDAVVAWERVKCAQAQLTYHDEQLNQARLQVDALNAELTAIRAGKICSRTKREGAE